MEFEKLGFSGWFQKRSKEFQPHKYELARVVAVNKDNFTIRSEEKEVSAEVTGKLLYGAESNLDLPTVGDWVHVEYFNERTLAIIHRVFPRRSLLKRKIAGKKIEYQLIASNIDTAFIIQSVDFDFYLRRLERYLAMANESDIKPVILLSKRDLISEENMESMISEIKYTNPGYDIIAFSNKTSEGLNEIRAVLKHGKTYCLLGSSGVGKTTLINRLIGEEVFATDAVREKDGKGRHVTARRHLIILEQGGMLIDTPGMRELGNIEISAGLKETFKEIIDLSQNCRFNNCTHVDEPGCSVIKAVEEDELSKKRYHNYLKIRRESDYYEMSYLDKRRKDRKFGKMYKSIMKTKKHEKL